LHDAYSATIGRNQKTFSESFVKQSIFLVRPKAVWSSRRYVKQPKLASQMKVYDGNLTGAAAETARASETQRTDREAGTRTGSSSGSASGDRVELSRALGSLSRALGSFSSSRAGRVQALAEQYQSGQYHVDAAATSRGLVSEAMAEGSH
jgi:anti-sigma28 factor (negative regulator of flagellin synthesis)